MTWNYTNIPVFHVLYINTVKDIFLLVTIIIKYAQGKWIKWFYGQCILATTLQDTNLWRCMLHHTTYLTNPLRTNIKPKSRVQCKARQLHPWLSIHLRARHLHKRS